MEGRSNQLIPKPGKRNPSDPASFRPIALTSVIRKTFTSILKDQPFNHFITNKYLSTDVQKGLVSHVSGYHKHQFKLVKALRDANTHQTTQSILWIDLHNGLAVCITS